MALVQIFSLNGVEIEYKKDSLTLKKENNSLSSDFKVPHSSFPFLIIENDKTKQELGPSDITSIRKNKIIPVIILENGVRYYGELQQLTILPKFRKCNLKYGSDLIAIISKKIADYMPTLSVIPGETTPETYIEESADVITGYANWPTYCSSIFGQTFPAKRFQFPMMFWKNKFGVDLEETNPNYSYQDNINNFSVDDSGNYTFVTNTFTIGLTTVTAENRNIVAPQVFLLSPLYYVFESIGWKILGSFVNHDLIKKLLLLSTKNNMTKIMLYAMKTDVFFTFSYANTTINIGFPMKKTSVTFGSLPAGTYVCSYRFVIPAQTSPIVNSITSSFRIKKVYNIFPFGAQAQNVIFNASYNNQEIIMEGEFEFSANPDIDVIFEYYNPYGQVLTDYSVFFRAKDSEKEYQEMHPTIQLSRYVPNWTIGNYLNYLKNQFNLDITIDDFKKQITLNLNEDLATNEEVAIISQSVALQSYDIAANSSFLLKYENDEDEALFITREETVIYDGNKDDFTKTLDSKFKFVPSNGYTSNLSEEVEDKEGVGLMIYEPSNAPFTSTETVTGYNLKIAGTKGIYETFFKRWIKFLLNASNCEVTGYFTEIEISKINKLKTVYINNQRFRIIDVETTEASNNFQEVKMRLLSINY